jgi:hypothetical protein
MYELKDSYENAEADIPTSGELMDAYDRLVAQFLQAKTNAEKDSVTYRTLKERLRFNRWYWRTIRDSAG